jgi:hypothetical protein
MTPEQKRELLAACEEDNDIRIVTIALQVAATAARARQTGVAHHIRFLVDNLHRKEDAEREYRRTRLTVATALFANNEHATAVGSCKAADDLIKACATLPVPE